jgi:transposase
MDAKELMATGWFPVLMEEVQRELTRLAADRQDPRPALRKERAALEENVAGWSQSLGKRDLHPTLRAKLEAEVEQTLTRLNGIDAAITEYDNRQAHVAHLLDPEQVIQTLNRLDDVLATDNPTAGNLELSLHIDRIDCYADGKVVLRTCKLGAIAAAVDLLAGDAPSDCPVDTPEPGTGTKRAKPRRRAKLRTDPFAMGAGALQAAAHRAADPGRFAGLAEHWFWEDVFQIPAKTCWAQEYAAEVAELRSAGRTMEQLAAHFRRSIPTIRDALRRAGDLDPSAPTLPRKMVRRRWAVVHAIEVVTLEQQGMSTREIARRFAKSETTIREALRIGRAAEATVSPVNTAATKDGLTPVDDVEDIQPPAASGSGAE